MIAKPTTRRSLTDFLAARPKAKRECSVCRLAPPLLAQINETRTSRQGGHNHTPCQVILEWLVAEIGIPSAGVTVKELQAHFYGKHHLGA